MPETLDKRGVLRYCWKAGEEVKCPEGCYCITEAAAKEHGYTARCQAEPYGHDQYQNLICCFKMPTGQACPTGCVCLTEDDAYKRYGQNAKLFRH